LSSSDDVREFSDGEVVVWIEQNASIHIKVVDRHGDPVELTEHEADELGKALIAMAQELRES